MNIPEFDWQRALSGAVVPGDLIAGKYRVEGLAGVGGMGIVVSATHVSLGERVAIKFLKPARLANPKARLRFDHEARAAFRIRSENVARVHDVGELPNGIPYMVMEYLEGRSLKQVLSDDGPVEFATAALYALQACDAVAQAHAIGIVHRDLKPSNLFLTLRPDGSPCVKVLDFGIAKSQASHGELTSAYRSMGTPRYMSPEQWLSARDAGPPADIWALGAILFELITGEGPYPTFKPDELREMVLKRPARSLTSSCPTAPAGLAAVVARCLERSPQNRFEDAAALVEALIEFAASPRQLAIPNASAGDSDAVAASAVSAGRGSEPRRGTRPIRRTAEHSPPLPQPDLDEPTTLDIPARDNEARLTTAIERHESRSAAVAEEGEPAAELSLDEEAPTHEAIRHQIDPSSAREATVAAPELVVAAADRSEGAAVEVDFPDSDGARDANAVEDDGFGPQRRGRSHVLWVALLAAVGLGVVAGTQWGADPSSDGEAAGSDLEHQAPRGASSSTATAADMLVHADPLPSGDRPTEGDRATATADGAGGGEPIERQPSPSQSSRVSSTRRGPVPSGRRKAAKSRPKPEPKPKRIEFDAWDLK